MAKINYSKLRKINDSRITDVKKITTEAALNKWLHKTKPGEYECEVNGHTVIMSIDEASSNRTYWTYVYIDGEQVYDQYESDIPAIPDVADLDFDFGFKQSSKEGFGLAQKLKEDLKQYPDVKVIISKNTLQVSFPDDFEWDREEYIGDYIEDFLSDEYIFEDQRQPNGRFVDIYKKVTPEEIANERIKR